MSDVDVLDGSLVLLGQLYDFADPNLIKAGWNWGLIHNDGSGGIHNPSFAFAALTSGIEVLDPSASPAAPWWLNSTDSDQIAISRQNN